MPDIKSAVQEQFGKTAANYRTSSVHAKGEDLQWMLEAVSITGSERVLDAACGAGHTAVTFAPHVREVVALDFTPAMLEQVALLAAERQLTNVITEHGDVEKLPFEDQSFDLVVTRYAAHHWPHPQIALQEIARILKPGGRLLLDDTIAPVEPLHDTFMQTVELIRDPSHVRNHSVQQWQTMLGVAAFRSSVVRTWNIPLNFDSWVERIATPAPNVTMLRTLFANAPEEVRKTLNIQPDSFTLPAALLRADLNA